MRLYAGAAWLIRVRHGFRVRYGSVCSVSGCCKAAPSSILGSVAQWSLQR
jgi:hypothetical protein